MSIINLTSSAANAGEKLEEVGGSEGASGRCAAAAAAADNDDRDQTEEELNLQRNKNNQDDDDDGETDSVSLATIIQKEENCCLQILSVENLPTEENGSNSTIEPERVIQDNNVPNDNQQHQLVEIDLTKQEEEEEEEEEKKMFSPSCFREAQINQISNINQQPRVSSIRENFDDTETKLSITSKRVKEYFNQFKSHGNEKLHLYQFFKSARTEFVACLLFVLITSQALIICNQSSSSSSSSDFFNQKSSSSSNHQEENNELKQDNDNNLKASSLSSSQIRTTIKQQQQNHLTTQLLLSGLINAFTITSLTQMFGHISGCHLIPSISIALFIKGHISRFRLASYLVAQSFGSLIGICLLSLLTSSQISQQEYNQLMIKLSASSDSNQLIGSSSSGSGFVMLPANFEELTKRQKRSFSDPEVEKTKLNLKQNNSREELVNNINLYHEAADEPPLNLTDLENSLGRGSETILLSIMEQQQQQRRIRRTGSLEPKTITNNMSTSSLSEPLSSSSSAASTSSSPYQVATTAKVVIFNNNLGGNNGLKEEPLEPQAAPPPPPLFSDRDHPNNKEETKSSSSLPPQSLPNSEPPTRPLSQVSGGESSSLSAEAEMVATRLEHETRPAQRASHQYNDNNNNNNDIGARGAQFQSNDKLAASSFSTIETTEPPRKKKQKKHVSLATSETGSTNSSSSLQKQQQNNRLRRRRGQPNNNNNNSLTTSNHSESLQLMKQEETTARYINLLHLALPNPIMSSESIGQCLQLQRATSPALARSEQQSQSFQTTYNTPLQTNREDLPAAAAAAATKRKINKQNLEMEEEEAEEAYLRRKSFNNCLSLSNSSQMFVFQLLATLLVVLTYLVNVDPRRIDQGFKSLSIGLAYFVSCAITIKSGGFYGNPFQLLFLAWFSSDPEESDWRSEWIIYLVTPLIGGLFGAMSHEYIDFTSLRNRNRKLHLRRSFHSLDNLTAATTTANSRRFKQDDEDEDEEDRMTPFNDNTCTNNNNNTTSTIKQQSESSRSSLYSNSNSVGGGAALSVITLTKLDDNDDDDDSTGETEDGSGEQQKRARKRDVCKQHRKCWAKKNQSYKNQVKQNCLELRPTTRLSAKAENNNNNNNNCHQHQHQHQHRHHHQHQQQIGFNVGGGSSNCCNRAPRLINTNYDGRSNCNGSTSTSTSTSTAITASGSGKQISTAPPTRRSNSQDFDSNLFLISSLSPQAQQLAAGSSSSGGNISGGIIRGNGISTSPALLTLSSSVNSNWKRVERFNLTSQM